MRGRMEWLQLSGGSAIAVVCRVLNHGSSCICEASSRRSDVNCRWHEASNDRLDALFRWYERLVKHGNTNPTCHSSFTAHLPLAHHSPTFHYGDWSSLGIVCHMAVFGWDAGASVPRRSAWCVGSAVESLDGWEVTQVTTPAVGTCELHCTTQPEFKVRFS
jgi:hypothetical protein